MLIIAPLSCSSHWAHIMRVTNLDNMPRIVPNTTIIITCLVALPPVLVTLFLRLRLPRLPVVPLTCISTTLIVLKCEDWAGIAHEEFTKQNEVRKLQVTKLQNSRIEKNRAKAIQLRRARISLLPRSDIAASPEKELAPVSNLRHHHATTQHRTRSQFGKGDACTARMHVNLGTAWHCTAASASVNSDRPNSVSNSVQVDSCGLQSFTTCSRQTSLVEQCESTSAVTVIDSSATTHTAPSSSPSPEHLDPAGSQTPGTYLAHDAQAHTTWAQATIVSPYV